MLASLNFNFNYGWNYCKQTVETSDIRPVWAAQTLINSEYLMCALIEIKSSHFGKVSIVGIFVVQ